MFEYPTHLQSSPEAPEGDDAHAASQQLPGHFAVMHTEHRAQAIGPVQDRHALSWVREHMQREVIAGPNKDPLARHRDQVLHPVAAVQGQAQVVPQIPSQVLCPH